MVDRAQSSSSRRSAPGRDAQRRPRDEEGPIPVLAKAAHGVELAVQRQRVTPTVRATFQAIALLVREVRVDIRNQALGEAQRAAQMKRIDGLATALARTAARDASLLSLLTDEAPLVSGATAVLRELRERAGLAAAEPEPEPTTPADFVDRRAIPKSAIARQLANPFLAPDFSAAPPARTRPRLLAGWELLGPLLRSFETVSDGAPSCMDLPEPDAMVRVPVGLELMHHQAGVVAAAAEGHRTFLLADEPGLGKTAQALLAAQAANAYPLLVVVPNVVKMSWAREAARWTPRRTATVVHSDGEDVDAFSDIVIVNYDILDRHVGWLGTLGFRGMVIDEAHFIKNKTSQRSRHVLDLSRQIRSRMVRPLLMALTGTPLINDIEDFLAIWEFLGWIDGKEPGPPLLDALEENGHTPAESDFYPAARESVINLGIVRRRKVDVAADIPARRIADMLVELDGEVGRSVREAEQRLAKRLVRRYDAAIEARGGPVSDDIDLELVRQIAASERRESQDDNNSENVFTMMRKIGQAKSVLAADYTAQLSRNAGKVVFFAKHIDVLDAAEETFARRGIGYASVRGDQSTKVRQKNIDAFVEDPDVHIIVCSLLAAGVGINLQVASNVVLAELSWTAAEQTQAIDRVHRIGQDQPVTAWRVIAAQTIEPRVAELIDEKANLAARALDGTYDETAVSVDVQTEALVTLLTEALAAR